MNKKEIKEIIVDEINKFINDALDKEMKKFFKNLTVNQGTN